MPLGEGGPYERGEKEKQPPLKSIILTLLALLTWKWLQIDTDMLLVITSAGNGLIKNVNSDDLEW